MNCERRSKVIILVLMAAFFALIYSFLFGSGRYVPDYSNEVPRGENKIVLESAKTVDDEFEKELLKDKTELNKEQKPTAESIMCRGKSQKLVNLYTRDMKGWFQNTKLCSSCFEFPKASLKTPYGNTPIFIYERDKDIWVSTSLQDRGTFETEKAQIIFKMLKDDPNLNFIDIGANIGVYTLSVAKSGRNVLAVEALDKNVQHICASLMEGDLQQKVFVVHNAVTNGHNVVSLGIDRQNMGGTFVDVDSEHIKKLKLGRAQGTYGKVHTITMDDLLQLPIINKFQKVFIKMDVEGFEAKAVEKSVHLFEKLEVVGFIMEWEFHRGQKSANKIIDFMLKNKYKPYAPSVNKIPFELSKNASWGYDVLWLPNK